MEQLRVRINDAGLYDRAIKESIPELGDMMIVTKDGAMESGRSSVMVTFRVTLPDGTIQRVQAATTVKLFKMACAALTGAYNDEGINIQEGRPQG